MRPLIFLFILSAALSSPLRAFPFDLRVKTGLNVSQHYGIEYGYEQYEVNKGLRWGVTGGLVFDFPVTDILTISQEFLFTTKGSNQTIRIKDQPIELEVFYQTEYLEFPTLFLLKYYRRNDFALFYQTGFSLSYLVYSRYDLSGNVDTGADDYELVVDQRIKNIDQFDFGIILGGGVEFSLFKRLLSLDYRINFGIPFIELPTTEDVFPDEENAERVRLRNQSYSISLGLFF